MTKALSNVRTTTFVMTLPAIMANLITLLNLFQIQMSQVGRGSVLVLYYVFPVMICGSSFNALWLLTLLLDNSCHCLVRSCPRVITPAHQMIGPGLLLPFWLISGRPGETSPLHLQAHQPLTCSTGSTCFGCAACHH